MYVYFLFRVEEDAPNAIPSSAGIRTETRQKYVEEHEEQMMQPKNTRGRPQQQEEEPEQRIIMETPDLGVHEKDRMACVEMLLAYANIGNNFSINSVDRLGRTALHYSAELGRFLACESIVRHSDIILTIIDDLGRTPCELAGLNYHHSLAVGLEARAVLIEDESGMNFDDVPSGSSSASNNLVTPFCWFTTKTLNTVQQDWDHRLNSTSEQLTQFLFHDFDIAKALYEYRHTPEPQDKNYGRFLDGIKLLENKFKNGDPSYAFPKYFSGVQIAHLLEYFGWNVKLAVKRFKKNPDNIIREVGLVMKSTPSKEMTSHQCPICLEDIVALDAKSDAPDDADNPAKPFTLKECKHNVCLQCLVRYIKSTLSEKLGLRIICPVDECKMLICKRDIEVAVSGYKDSSLIDENKSILKMLWTHECENFVAAAKDLRFCPFVDCPAVVQRTLSSQIVEPYDEDSVANLPAVCTFCDDKDDPKTNSQSRTYEGVPYSSNLSCNEALPKAHRFCFSCLKDPHWPASCTDVSKWLNRLIDEKKEIRSSLYEVSDSPTNEDIAQQMWLRANTRPCPKCKAPIEKDEGCNHMTCTNRRCKHEFCWICRQPWRLHGKRTGGFFRCNKWQEDEASDNAEAKSDPDLDTGTAQFSAYAARQASATMAHFLHYFNRYTAHLESSDLERNMADNVCTRLAPVIEASLLSIETDVMPLWDGLYFIHAAFVELLECRSVLKNSYIFAFYRYLRSNSMTFTVRLRKEKIRFEALQSELEMITEHLSDIVGRKHLRATRKQIQFLTSVAAEKRRELYHFVIKTSREQGKSLARKANRSEVLQNTLPSERKNNLTVASLALESERMEFSQRAINPSNEIPINDIRRSQENEIVENALMAHAIRTSLNESSSENNRSASARNERESTWSCKICTFDNTANIEICAMCQRRKNSDV